MRVGGPFEVLMRAPDGVEHWVSGKFVEVSKFDRLTIDMIAEDGKGHALMRAFTELRFSDALGGTRLDVAQTYTIIDPDAAMMVRGAPEGWAQTLDNLSAELRRMQTSADAPARSSMRASRSSAPTTRRSSGSIRRCRTRRPRPNGSAATKDQWRPIERSMDFRVGGRERAKGRWEGGIVSTFDAVYHDIVPNERIVYSYEMHLDEKKISVSLATMQLKPAGPGRTTLKVTEQGAFLDGYDDAGSREHGTGFLLDKLGASLGAPNAGRSRGG